MRFANTTDVDPEFVALVERTRQHRVLALAPREVIVECSAAAFFAAIALTLDATTTSSRSPSLWLVATLLVLYAAFSRIDFEVGAGSAVPSELVLVAMYAFLPAQQLPFIVALGMIAGHVPDFARGTVNPRRVIRLLGSAGFSIGPAALLIVLREPTPTLDTLPLYGAVLGCQFLADGVITVTRERLGNGAKPTALVTPLATVFMVDALLFPIGFVTAVAMSDDVRLIGLVAPLAALLMIFSRERQARLTSTLELSNAYRGTAFLLGDVVEADDAYTGSHSRDVVGLVLAVCDHLQLDARDRRRAEFTALLHDVGKIRIPEGIINKPGPLDPDERAIINTHTILGQELLERVGGLLSEVGSLVRSCHEHYDGSGYPDGLSGDDIPLIARIVACCDAYNAMTTDRSYRPAMTTAAALAELQRCAGSQFDPRVVTCLSATISERLA
jgi:HD-GYP domain-containing protein (c-di-GMP phosphodiesterase class II)